MTIAEALAASTAYPLSGSTIELICLKRGMNPTDDLVDPGVREYRLAEADVKMFIAKFPSSVSEGGLSVSKSETDLLRYEANAVYSEYGETEASAQPKATWYQC